MLDRPSEPKDMFTTLKRDRTEPRPNRSSSLWVHAPGGSGVDPTLPPFGNAQGGLSNVEGRFARREVSLRSQL